MIYSHSDANMSRELSKQRLWERNGTLVKYPLQTTGRIFLFFWNSD